MGSVSRGRCWRRGIWGALSPSDGMALWVWLLAAVLLSLLTVSVARPPLTATREVETKAEPEGEKHGRRNRGAIGDEQKCSYRGASYMSLD